MSRPLPRLASILSQLVARKPARRCRHRRLGLEILEDRRLMAADINFFNQYMLNETILQDVIVIEGTNLADTAQVAFDGDEVSIDLWAARANGSTDHLSFSRDREDVQWVVFMGLDGANAFTNLTDLPSHALGGSGVDTFLGGSAADMFSGGGGNDILVGGGGNDTLLGGANDDTLEGGDGDDSLSGNLGSDTYRFVGVNLGADTITETEPAVAQIGIPRDIDTIDLSGFTPPTTQEYRVIDPNSYTELHLDVTEQQTVFAGHLQLTLFTDHDVENVIGSSVSDVIYGNALENRIWGGGSRDQLFGENGRDWLWGGEGNDRLIGGGDNDSLYGENGHDSLRGGQGNDALEGGAGYDLLVGDEQVDYLRGAWENASIAGGEFWDASQFDARYREIYNSTATTTSDFLAVIAGAESTSAFNGSDTLYGGADPDVIYGGSGRDTIFAGGGNDWVYAGGGGGSVFGDAGNDILYGGSGLDYLYGQADNDRLFGGGEGDYLFGDSGIDALYAEAGSDYLYGGTENDFLYGGDGLDRLYGQEGSDWLDGGRDNYADVLDGGALDSAGDVFVRHVRRIRQANGHYIDAAYTSDEFKNLASGMDTVFTLYGS
jgi:Ca2+-binding RTX toxin-like protein